MKLLSLKQQFLAEFESETTIATYNHGMKTILQFLSSKGIDSVDKLNVMVLKEYRRSLDTSYTARKRVIVLKSFCKWLFNNDITKNNLAKAIKMVKQPANLVERICSKTDVQKMIDTAEKVCQSTKLMLQIMKWTGIRIRACSTIKIANIIIGDDIKMKVLSKGNIWRWVSICNDKADLIRDQLKGDTYLFPGRYGKRPISRSAASARIKKIADLAGIKASAHYLRHFFCTSLIEAKCSLPTVMKAMNHKSLNTTSLYVHSTEKDVSKYI